MFKFESKTTKQIRRRIQAIQNEQTDEERQLGLAKLMAVIAAEEILKQR